MVLIPLTKPARRIAGIRAGRRDILGHHRTRPDHDIVDDPMIARAFGPWKNLIEGTPRLAHERFYWSRDSNKLGVGLGV